MFSVVRKTIYSAFVILLFGVVVPVWVASAKAEQTFSPRAESLSESACKLIGHARKILLTKVDSECWKNQLSLYHPSFTEVGKM
ncbi:MAG: hypothetical protein ACRC2T_01650 [Thermoguttaceae bacterium]